MKKFLSVFAAILLVATLFSCGNGDTGKKINSEDEWKQAFDKLLEFERPSVDSGEENILSRADDKSGIRLTMDMVEQYGEKDPVEYKLFNDITQTWFAQYTKDKKSVEIDTSTIDDGAGGTYKVTTFVPGAYCEKKFGNIWYCTMSEDGDAEGKWGGWEKYEDMDPISGDEDDYNRMQGSVYDMFCEMIEFLKENYNADKYDSTEKCYIIRISSEEPEDEDEPFRLAEADEEDAIDLKIYFENGEINKLEMEIIGATDEELNLKVSTKATMNIEYVNEMEMPFKHLPADPE